MYSLLPYNTFAVPAQTHDLITIDETTDLDQTLQPYHDTPKLIIGGGSNMLLVHDRPGVAIINQIRGRQIISEDDTSITIQLGAGENRHETVMRSVQQGYRGIENLALIPGTVGAAPIQNIGAYGAEVSNVITSVGYYDMISEDYVTLTHPQCLFSYRDSIFKHDLRDVALITSVNIQLSKIPKPILNYGGLQDKVGAVPYFELWGGMKPGVDIQIRHNVACIIKHHSEDKYLFIREKDSGKITMAAGGVEAGEDHTQAGIREIIEETGYTNIIFDKIVLPEIHFSCYNERKGVNRYGIVQVINYILVNENHTQPEDSNTEAVWLTAQEAGTHLENINKYCFAIHQGTSVQPEGRALSEKNQEKNLGPLTFDLGPKQVANAVIQIRSSKLPDWTQVGTAGSFFKNPIISQSQLDQLLTQYPDCPHRDFGHDQHKISAGWILDHTLGYRGKNSDSSPVGCRDHQALVLVNRGGATGQQVRDRAQHLISECHNKLGITLEPEVNII